MIDIEQHVRSALQQRAQSTTLTHPPASGLPVAAPHGNRPVLLVVSLVAIVATVVGLVALTGHSGAPATTSPATTSAVTSPTAPSTVAGPTTTATVTTATPTTISAPSTVAVGRGWRVLPAAPIANRDDPAAVWTGSQLLVWGGGTAGASPLANGAAYDMARGSWAILPAAPITARNDPVSVFTGTEMIVWGGTDVTTASLSDGAAYNPTTDGWRTIAAAPVEGTTATFASTVWTGRELIIWGGDNPDGQPRSTGAAYNPTTDKWRVLTQSPLQPRHDAATVWTGTEMLVWGGSPAPGPGFAPFADGAAYNPTTDTWRSIAASPLAARIAPAVWTGTEMIITAGRTKDGNGPFAFGDGAAYDPTHDTWRKIAEGPAHPGFRAAWTGTALLVVAKGGGFSYDPASDAWTSLDNAGMFPGAGPALWTGRDVLLVGTAYNTTTPIGFVTAYTPQ